jgi:hypothetical protein
VTLTTRSDLQRRLAAEFDRRLWQYEMDAARAIVDAVEAAGAVDPQYLADRVPAGVLRRNGIDRPTMAEAIEAAIGGFTLKPPEPTMSTTAITINDNRYQVNVGAGASMDSSKINVGDGQQINVDVEAPKDQVLEAVRALVRAGLTGDWNDGAAGDLAKVLAGRVDIGLDDIQVVTAEIVEAEQPTQGKVKALLGKIAVSGLGGALGTGIATGAAQILPYLPL